MPYRIRAVAAGRLRTFVLGQNILRFAASSAGTYCENISIVRYLVSLELTDGLCNRTCTFAACRQTSTEYAGRQPQTEMPNRASFLELHAARLARFGDSGVIEAARLVSTGSMSINGHKFKRWRAMGLVREETFAEVIELGANGSLSDLGSLFERSID